MAWDTSTWTSVEATAAMLNARVRDNFKAIGDAWASYTPTWTATGSAPSLGNGTLTGAYSQAGKRVSMRMKLTAGSTTTFGTGTWSFTLPVTAKSADSMVLQAWIFDSGTRHFVAAAKLNATTSFSVVHSESGNSGQVDASNPMTWATSDFLVVTGEYEAA